MFTYEAVPGFFAQDEPNDPTTIPVPLPPRFGLLDDAPGAWARLTERLAALNEQANGDEVYKLLFLARHGQGYHNIGYEKYGRSAWDRYWSKRNGDGEIVWGPDPELTALGIAQARAVNQAWKVEIPAGVPLPQRSFCSPMTRAMRTYVLTFEDVPLQQSQKPLVLESLREEYGSHTCDKRRSLTYIHHEFPQFDVEPGFTEEDELWTNKRETEAHLFARLKRAMDQLFWVEATIISVTAHDGAINGLIHAVGRPWYNLAVGGVLPMVVKGARVRVEDAQA